MPHLWKVAAAAAAALILPTTAASAATLSADGSKVTYQAAPGEVNQPVLATPYELGVGFFATVVSDTVAVAPGAGCVAGPPVACGPFADGAPQVYVKLGDGDDSARAPSNVSLTDLDGGSGDDDLDSGGLTAYAEGGSGDDRIRVYGQFATRAHGDAGDDAIWAPGLTYPTLYGDAGNDLIALPGRGSSTFAEGGTGNDRLVESRLDGGGGRLTGGTGDDILAGQPDGGSGRYGTGAAGPFDGGSGNDVLSAPYGRNTDDGGSGDDLIDVIDSAYVAPDPEDPGSSDWGYQDTVTCGSGQDEVWADPADIVAADCEVVHRTLTHPTLPGVEQALADAAALYAS